MMWLVPKLFWAILLSMLVANLGDECSNPDWHTLHSQVVLPVILVKQLLVQSQELGRRFAACSHFIKKTATHFRTTLAQARCFWDNSTSNVSLPQN